MIQREACVCLCVCQCGAHVNKLTRPDVWIKYHLRGADKPASGQNKMTQNLEMKKNFKTPTHDFSFGFLNVKKKITQMYYWFIEFNL